MTAVNKLSRAMDIIAKIMMVFVILGFVLSLVGTIVLASFSDKTIEITGDVITKFSITSDNEKIADALRDSANYQTEDSQMRPSESGAEITEITTWGLNFHDLRLFLIDGMIVLACLFTGLFFFSKLAKHLSKSETPFTMETVKLLKTLGIVIIAAFLVATVMNDILLSNISLLKANSINMSFEINVSYIIYILAYIALIKIFKYGAGLEEEKAAAAAEAGAAQTRELPESTDGDAGGSNLS